MRNEELVADHETLQCCKEKPSPRGEGGSAQAESDEGLTCPKDHLSKEREALSPSSVDV